MPFFQAGTMLLLMMMVPLQWRYSAREQGREQTGQQVRGRRKGVRQEEE